MQADVDPDAIADCVLHAFDALPAHRKPRQASAGLKHGKKEWVPLAGIVIARDSGYDGAPVTVLECAALATGMKCMPQAKIASLEGNVIHDSHAEILAIRAFNRFLLEECERLVTCQTASELDNHDSVLQWAEAFDRPQDPVIEPSNRQLSDIQTSDHVQSNQEHDCATGETPDWNNQPFSIKPNVRLHMYCSEAPCGDASMELTMAAQDDATPWTAIPAKEAFENTTSASRGSDDNDKAELYGRSYFQALGVVRRKPSRPDAPPTLSKSCSDKLALKQCTSLLSSVTSLLIHPGNAYLESLILPSSQHIPQACQRSFGSQGRMAPMLAAHEYQKTGYTFRPFSVRSTNHEFAYSRRQSESPESVTLVPSNISSLAFGKHQETLINGILQGRKSGDPKGASVASRRKMWSLAVEVVKLLQRSKISPRLLSRKTYADFKSITELSARSMMKRRARDGPLRGWKRNLGDDQWSL